jgi:transposase
MSKRWAEAPAPRHQLVFLSPSCDDQVGADHPIRALDAFLEELDWVAWEAHYNGHRGQPPIHPRLLAGCLLYGLLKGIRSTRALEEATGMRLDFMWFLEGRTIDHSTFAQFRCSFGEELKGLNKQLSQILRRDSKDQLVELVIDGTRVRSNSSRTGAKTAGTLERNIGKCEERLNGLLDKLEEEAEDEAPETTTVQEELERLERRRAKLYQALAVAEERDAAKRKKDGKKATPVRVPVTDPDSMILPNKDGGYAPNFTATVAVDKATGAIVEADVVEGANECAAVKDAVEAAEEIYQAPVDRVLADGGFSSGENLAYLEEHKTDSYMPTGLDFRSSNPANRDDPSQPVPEDQREHLPRSGGKFSQAAFVYQEENDCYYCPMGKVLNPIRNGTTQTTYRCPGKAGCPVAAQCVKGKKAQHRTILRDQHQSVREQTAMRMASEQGQEIYRQRAPVVEGVFGIVKHNMGIRQFLLRGREKVRIEWNWISAAFNLGKLLAQGHARKAKSPNNGPDTSTSKSKTAACGLRGAFFTAVRRLLLANRDCHEIEPPFLVA